jgi:hypothetical protein
MANDLGLGVAENYLAFAGDARGRSPVYESPCGGATASRLSECRRGQIVGSALVIPWPGVFCWRRERVVAAGMTTSTSGHGGMYFLVDATP